MDNPFFSHSNKENNDGALYIANACMNAWQQHGDIITSATTKTSVVVIATTTTAAAVTKTVTMKIGINT